MGQDKLQYAGYLNTPSLWENDILMGIKQFVMDSNVNHSLNIAINENLMLGKRAENFFRNYIEYTDEYRIVLANKQIHNKQITIGEFDFILAKNNSFLHVECVYKFYLFNPENVINNELDGWIGPNNKDYLVAKLNKLKNHQLPLLYNEHAKELLEEHHINLSAIQQEVCFKAQLFLNIKFKPPKFEFLNKACITGFWMYYKDFLENDDYVNYKFYIPKKQDWLMPTKNNINWLTYNNFCNVLKNIISQRKSPLCWFKNTKGNIKKGFIVWW